LDAEAFALAPEHPPINMRIVQEGFDMRQLLAAAIRAFCEVCLKSALSPIGAEST